MTARTSDPVPDLDPVATLLQTEDTRAAAVRALSDNHQALLSAMGSYRDAWRAARETGWARTDLVRAGLLDPRRLPQIRRRAQPLPSTTGQN